MASFAAICIIGMVNILITWLLAYEVLGAVWNLLPRLHILPRLKVVLIGIPIFIIHIAGIWIYAGVYFLIENYTNLGKIIGYPHVQGINAASFLDCLYFSSAIYTSLGLGDLIPTENLRMLVAAEVLNGLVLIGWTVSFTYLTMEKFWQTPRIIHNDRQHKEL